MTLMLTVSYCLVGVLNLIGFLIITRFRADVCRIDPIINFG